MTFFSVERVVFGRFVRGIGARQKNSNHVNHGSETFPVLSTIKKKGPQRREDAADVDGDISVPVPFSVPTGSCMEVVDRGVGASCLPGPGDPVE